MGFRYIKSKVRVVQYTYETLPFPWRFSDLWHKVTKGQKEKLQTEN